MRNEHTENKSGKKIRVHEMQWSEFEGDRQRWNWYMVRFVMKILQSVWAIHTTCRNEMAYDEKESKWKRRRQMKRKNNNNNNHNNNNVNKCATNDRQEYTQSMSVHYTITNTIPFALTKVKIQHQSNCMFVSSVCELSEMWIL